MPNSYLTGAMLALASIVPISAQAQDVTLELFYAYPSSTEFLEPITEDFMKLHPEITVKLQAPAIDYADAHQSVVRSILTNRLPDVYLAGYSVLRPLVDTLNERDLAVDLKPFMDAEGNGWTDVNYAEAVLGLGQVDGGQYAIPFNASTPILYVNADLVKAAGGSMDAFPSDWESVIELAKKINALSDDISGINLSLGGLGVDWFWEAMVLSNGAEMVNSEENGIGYDNDAGLRALQLAQKISLETDMTVDTGPDPYRQQFFAGKLGMFVASPSGVAGFTEAVGGRFEMTTARFPVTDKDNGGLPTGGNAVAVLSQDEAQQKAAWELVKYMTSAEVQAEIAKSTGYMPTNKNSAEALADFYAANPNFQTVFKQMDYAAPWYAYPDNKGGDVWKIQSEILDQLQRGNLTPEEALSQMSSRIAEVLD